MKKPLPLPKDSVIGELEIPPFRVTYKVLSSPSQDMRPGFAMPDLPGGKMRVTLILDWRRRMATPPFEHRGMWFDSAEHALAHDIRCGRAKPGDALPSDVDRNGRALAPGVRVSVDLSGGKRIGTITGVIERLDLNRRTFYVALEGASFILADRSWLEAIA